MHTLMGSRTSYDCQVLAWTWRPYGVRPPIEVCICPPLSLRIFWSCADPIGGLFSQPSRSKRRRLCFEVLRSRSAPFGPVVIMSSRSTPSKRQRTNNGRGGSNNFLANAMDSETTFVMKHLESKPGLLMSIASMLREGTPERAISDFGNGGSKGGVKVLAPSAKKMRDLRVKGSLSILRGLSTKIEEEVGKVDVNEAIDAAEKEQLYNSLLQWATDLEGGSNLPIEYEDFRTFSTLVAMFKVRYEQCGRRLDKWTAEHPWNFGHYAQCDQEVAGAEADDFMCIATGKKFKVEIPLRILKKNKLSIENNHSVTGASLKAGSSPVNLLTAMKTELGDDVPLPAQKGDWCLDGFRKVSIGALSEAGPSAPAPLVADSASSGGAGSVAGARPPRQ